MKEYVIYTRVKDKDGKQIILYAAYNDECGAKFIKKEDEGFYKIVKFPTMNSAIIWWRGHIEWIGVVNGFYSSVLEYDSLISFLFKESLFFIRFLKLVAVIVFFSPSISTSP